MGHDKSPIIYLVSLPQVLELFETMLVFCQDQEESETFVKSWYRFGLNVVCFRKEFRLCLAFIVNVARISIEVATPLSELELD